MRPRRPPEWIWLAVVPAVLVAACAAPSSTSSEGTSTAAVSSTGSVSSTVSPVSPAVTPSLVPSDSLGHEDALSPTDPSSGVPSYGYYALLLDPPKPTPHFTLTDDRGRPFHFDPAREAMHAGGGMGEPYAVTLLYFGYTHCPDLCPSELATIAGALRQMPMGVTEKIQMVFVTVDPARDDVARMHEYVRLFYPTFVGLTGSKSSVLDAQLAMGLDPAVKVPSGGGEYAMRHTAEVFAFTPDGYAHLAFPFGMTVSQWRYDLWKLVEEGWRGTT